MTDARLTRQSVRVLQSNPGPIRLTRQSVRVLNSSLGPVRLTRQSVRVLNNDVPVAARLGTQSVQGVVQPGSSSSLLSTQSVQSVVQPDPSASFLSTVTVQVVTKYIAQGLWGIEIGNQFPTGLQLRLQASAVSGTDGSTFMTWPDSSEYGRDFAGNGYWYSSTYTTPKGTPVVSGLVGGWTFSRTSFMGSAAAAEIIYVVKFVNSGNNNMGLWSSDSQQTHWMWSDNNIYDSFGSTARKSFAPGAAFSYNWHVVSEYSAANDWGVFIDNGTTPVYSTATNTVGFGTTHTLGSAGANTWHQVAEVLLFDRKLTTGERTYLFAYLSGLYL